MQIARFALFLGLMASALPAKQILSGQLIVDTIHPHSLRQFGRGPVFICGPGDPEGFLYRGKLNSDGTRDGDQEALIRKLAEHGGNCIYLQAVRSHGGDGDKTHNPFLNNDPSQGINTLVLDQWEQWFTLMDRHQILIYFFIYDDSSDPWRSGSAVSDAEQRFVTALVDRFEHHLNLIWIVAEESEEALPAERARALGRLIRQSDDHGHLVGNHHHSGTEFKSWSEEGPFDHYAMQLNVPLDQVHGKAVEAAAAARGKYQMIWAENTEIEDSPDARRRFAWECAMGGLMPMLLNMNIADTSPDELKSCRALSRFFLDGDFQRLQPADHLAAGPTTHVLADPGRSYLAYAAALPDRGQLTLNDLPAGTYHATWLDCRSGVTSRTRTEVNASAAWPKPGGFGPEVALLVERIPHRKGVFPGAEWEKRAPAELGLDPKKLKQFTDLTGGRGVIVRDGYLVHTWGDANEGCHPKWQASAVSSAERDFSP